MEKLKLVRESLDSADEHIQILCEAVEKNQKMILNLAHQNRVLTSENKSIKRQLRHEKMAHLKTMNNHTLQMEKMAQLLAEERERLRVMQFLLLKSN